MPVQLLDLETEYQVRRMAPLLSEYSPNDARMLIGALEKFSMAENRRTGLDDRPYYWAFLSDLMPELPEVLSPKRAGLLCRALCLTMRRRGPGFIVAWNNSQLQLLNEYFNGDRSER